MNAIIGGRNNFLMRSTLHSTTKTRVVVPLVWRSSSSTLLTRVRAAPDEEDTRQEQKVQQDDEPVWVRRERERELMAKEGSKDLPFGVYLLFSAMVAIAAIGSIFEYANKNPIFDVIYPDSPFYAPILGVFAITGVPTAGYLFYKAVSSANAEAERMDKLDGY
ncbi:hypothetical protein PSENEW3_00000545 [Picochlorum sp. SENEW3]|nr:hypothetical protein PSENEW3_00000545 [Picochlorum sp. SENEW3]